MLLKIAITSAFVMGAIATPADPNGRDILKNCRVCTTLTLEVTRSLAPSLLKDFGGLHFNSILNPMGERVQSRQVWENWPLARL